jgi:hypothetical protein
MSREAKAKVRIQRLLKHYKNNLLTQAGNPTEDTVDNLLVDLHHYCAEKGLDLVDRMNEAARATEPPPPPKKPHVYPASVKLDEAGMPVATELHLRTKSA